MRLLEYLDRKKERRKQILQEERDRQLEIRKEKIESRKEVMKEAAKVAPMAILARKSFDVVSKEDEPFGWPKGTVRGVITIWIVLTFCIIMMWDIFTGAGKIPTQWYLAIIGAVIMSYFYSRYKMGNGQI